MNENLATRLSSGTVVITGAGGSVAPSVALAFFRHGAKVVLVTRTGKERGAVAGLPGAEELIGAGRMGVVGADLADAADTRAAFESAAERHGQASVLVNLAGGFALGGADDTGEATVSDMLEMNLFTAVNATLAVLPGMLARGAGAVLAVGAVAARAPAPGRTAYAAAKAAVAAYFRSLAAEVGQGGVTVGVLHPMGTIDTSANRKSMPRADTSQWIQPEAVAEGLLYLAGGGPGGRIRELELLGG